MSYSIRFHEAGGPDVLQVEEGDPGMPGPGEALVRHAAVGLNYVETYQRAGRYPISLPSGLGTEAAGTVEAVGEGVTDVSAGDRVAYCTGPLGAYADLRVLPAERLVRLPSQISFEQGAAMMLKGLTAQYLLRRTYSVQPGDHILIHAAAGGVGLMVCQWAHALGAIVIGSVGTPEKAALARAHGCDHTILYRDERFLDRVREITGGEGVPVVYDSVGKDTFADSLLCLRPMGMLVSFGQSSGAVPPFNISDLSRLGSLFLTRPTLYTYAAKRPDLLSMSAELFDMVESGHVKIEIGQRYPLREVVQAHRDLEARRTTGSTVLIP